MRLIFNNKSTKTNGMSFGYEGIFLIIVSNSPLMKRSITLSAPPIFAFPLP